MYALEVPEHGGETFYACGKSALASAPLELQMKARRLLVHYVYDEVMGRPILQKGIRRVGFDIFGNGSVAGHTGGAHVVHPLIRKHPETGEESVFLSCANVDYMEAT